MRRRGAVVVDLGVCECKPHPRDRPTVFCVVCHRLRPGVTERSPESLVVGEKGSGVLFEYPQGQ